MANELVPSEEEFEVIISALDYYQLRQGQLIATEEVLKATQRLAKKAESEVSENEKAFEVFNPEAKPMQFVEDLAKAIDQKALTKKVNEEADKLTLLTAKIIRFRDECRRLGTNKAIDDLLK